MIFFLLLKKRKMRKARKTDMRVSLVKTDNTGTVEMTKLKETSIFLLNAGNSFLNEAEIIN